MIRPGRLHTCRPNLAADSSSSDGSCADSTGESATADWRCGAVTAWNPESPAVITLYLCTSFL
jgi:hypothetical protein